jgi:hypothetical protein
MNQESHEENGVQDPRNDHDRQVDDESCTEKLFAHVLILSRRKGLLHV